MTCLVPLPPHSLHLAPRKVRLSGQGILLPTPPIRDDFLEVADWRVFQKLLEPLKEKDSEAELDKEDLVNLAFPMAPGYPAFPDQGSCGPDLGLCVLFGLVPWPSGPVLVWR